MGDILSILERLGVGTVTAILLIIIIWLIWQLFRKFEGKFAALEGPNGTLQKMENRIDEHDVCLAVHAQQLKNLEFDAERDERRR